MWKRMLGSRWFYVVAMTGMVTLFLASQIEWTGDSRELENVDGSGPDLRVALNGALSVRT